MPANDPFATSLSDAALAIARLANLREDVARFAMNVGIDPAEPWLVLIEAQSIIQNLRIAVESATGESPF